jgi:hypothetical protein
MIHLPCVTAARNVIILNTQLYLSNLYIYYFQSHNILYSSSNHQLNTKVAVIKYLISYCQINLNLTIIYINSVRYEFLQISRCCDTQSGSWSPNFRRHLLSLSSGQRSKSRSRGKVPMPIGPFEAECLQCR